MCCFPKRPRSTSACARQPRANHFQRRDRRLGLRVLDKEIEDASLQLGGDLEPTEKHRAWSMWKLADASSERSEARRARISSSSATSTAWRVGRVAGGAQRGKPGATVPAELLACRVLVLASGTAHPGPSFVGGPRLARAGQGSQRGEVHPATGGPAGGLPSGPSGVRPSGNGASRVTSAPLQDHEDRPVGERAGDRDAFPGAGKFSGGLIERSRFVPVPRNDRVPSSGRRRTSASCWRPREHRPQHAHVVAARAGSPPSRFERAGVTRAMGGSRIRLIAPARGRGRLPNLRPTIDLSG